MTTMTADERRGYAAKLMLEHARDVEFLSIFEMAEEHAGREIDVDDAQEVADLIIRATITVSWEPL